MLADREQESADARRLLLLREPADQGPERQAVAGGVMDDERPRGRVRLVPEDLPRVPALAEPEQGHRGDRPAAGGVVPLARRRCGCRARCLGLEPGHQAVPVSLQQGVDLEELAVVGLEGQVPPRPRDRRAPGRPGGSSPGRGGRRSGGGSTPFSLGIRARPDRPDRLQEGRVHRGIRVERRHQRVGGRPGDLIPRPGMRPIRRRVVPAEGQGGAGGGPRPGGANPSRPPRARP